MYKTGIMKTQDSPIPVISVGNITLGGTGKTPVVERLSASVTAALLAAQRGAHILRVHDVAATRNALAVWQAVRAG